MFRIPFRKLLHLDITLSVPAEVPSASLRRKDNVCACVRVRVLGQEKHVGKCDVHQLKTNVQKGI